MRYGCGLVRERASLVKNANSGAAVVGKRDVLHSRAILRIATSQEIVALPVMPQVSATVVARLLPESLGLPVEICRGQKRADGWCNWI